MKKVIINLIYFASVTFSIVSIHEAFADRGPSVEPFAEVDIENQNQKQPNGFNFDSQTTTQKERKPAGIVPKDPNNTSSPYSMIGPIIFLLAVPVALWLMITKKFKHEDTAIDKTDYYHKTFQFKPYQTEYQKQDEDNDDDIDYPKAS